MIAGVGFLCTFPEDAGKTHSATFSSGTGQRFFSRCKHGRRRSYPPIVGVASPWALGVMLVSVPLPDANNETAMFAVGQSRSSNISAGCPNYPLQADLRASSPLVVRTQHARSS
jgi:hypothetical protein